MSILNKKDLEIILYNNFGPRAKIVNYELKRFTEKKAGFFGEHFCLRINGSIGASSSVNISKSFFVKTAPASATLREEVLGGDIYNQEIVFYKEIQPLLIEHGCKDSWSPRCQLIKKDALVLEDLRARNYAISRDDMLSEGHLRAAFTALARLHASSVLTEAHLNKSLKRLCPRAFVEHMFGENNKYGRVTDLSFQTLARLGEKFGCDTSLLPKIRKRVYEAVRRVRADRTNAVCHGDLWKNNLLFNDDVDPPRCILVDYQFIRYTSPCVDVSILVYLNTTPEFRRRGRELEMIKYYYARLRDAVRANDKRVVISSLNDIIEDYQELKLIGMVYGCFYLPASYMKEEFDKFLNDDEALLRYMLENKIDFMLDKMRQDSTYEQTVKDIISELFEVAGQMFQSNS